MAIVLAAIGALSLLPALTVQLVSPTKPDRPVPAPTPAAVQAPEPAARASGVDKKGKPSGGAPLKGRPSVGKHRPVGMGKGAGEGGGITVGMGEQGVGGAGGGVGVRELKKAERPLGGVSEDRGEGRVPETGTISGGMAEDGRGEKGTPQGKGRSLAVRREGEGGELPDGRNRCFIDPDGFHRCYPTVFFFGTSKCGEDRDSLGSVDLGDFLNSSEGTGQGGVGLGKVFVGGIFVASRGEGGGGGWGQKGAGWGTTFV